MTIMFSAVLLPVSCACADVSLADSPHLRVGVTWCRWAEAMWDFVCRHVHAYERSNPVCGACGLAMTELCSA
jgi:hypothetical protein